MLVDFSSSFRLFFSFTAAMIPDERRKTQVIASPPPTLAPFLAYLVTLFYLYHAPPPPFRPPPLSPTRPLPFVFTIFNPFQSPPPLSLIRTLSKLRPFLLACFPPFLSSSFVPSFFSRVHDCSFLFRSLLLLLCYDVLLLLFSFLSSFSFFP